MIDYIIDRNIIHCNHFTFNLSSVLSISEYTRAMTNKISAEEEYGDSVIKKLTSVNQEIVPKRRKKNVYNFIKTIKT